MTAMRVSYAGPNTGQVVPVFEEGSRGRDSLRGRYCMKRQPESREASATNGVAAPSGAEANELAQTRSPLAQRLHG